MPLGKAKQACQRMSSWDDADQGHTVNVGPWREGRILGERLGDVVVRSVDLVVFLESRIS